MVVGDNFAYIHVPKTGGMSTTRFLLNNVSGQIVHIAQQNAQNHHNNMIDKLLDAKDRVRYIAGNRHATLIEAREMIVAHDLPEPEFVFVVIRDPVDLMMSYYKHMRSPHVWELRGMTAETLSGEPLRAMTSDFDTFAFARKGFYHRGDDEVMEFYSNPQAGFAQVDVIPLERLGTYLERRFSSHEQFGFMPLEKRNASRETFGPVSTRTAAYIRETAFPKLFRLFRTAMESKLP